VLFVSTAGMLLRREVFATLGGFDARFTAFADDLDLCWRVWLSGRRVGVVPQAVGYHHAAGSAGSRRGLDAAAARALRERNALAAKLKNYSARRLLWVLPLGFLLDTGQLLALALSRRFGEAFAVVRAYAWNLGQLPATLRRRRVVQSARRVPDADLAGLFAPGLPRVRQVVDSALEVVAGGTTKALVDADDVGRVGVDPLADQPIQRFLRDRPLVLLGVPLLVSFGLSLLGHLGSGPLVGGQVLPFPSSAAAFLRGYLSPWGPGPLASAAFPSPLQPLLGLVALAGGGNAGVAQRIAVFGLVPLAFATALRAGRLVTRRPWPRVVGAAVYAVSPVVLAPVGDGRWGIAVTAALLPAVASLVVTTANPAVRGGAAWRSTALLAIALVVVVAAAPVESLVPLLGVAAAVATALVRGWARPLLRLSVAVGGAALLLAPWLLDVVRAGGFAGGALASAVPAPSAGRDLPVWRALVGQPAGVEGLDGLLAVLLLCLPAAVLLGALFVGLRARPLVTGALVLLVVASGVAAWAAVRADVPLLDATALLLPGALATAVLAVVAARWSAETLTASDFGLSQVGTAVAGILLVVGLVAGLGLLAGGPWGGLAADPQLVPAFIGADDERVGPYRVLLLAADADGGPVTWEVTGEDGPTALDLGAVRDPGLTGVVQDAVTRIDAGADTSAAAVLGVLNVRYVVLVDPADRLRAALSRQADLEPLPSEAAVTYRVRTWLPRAAVVPQPAADRLLATGDPGPTDALVAEGAPLQAGALRPAGPGRYVGGEGGAADGVLVVSEAATPAWRAAAGGVELVQVEDAGPVTAFALPEGGLGAVTADDPIRVAVGGGLRRRLVVAAQVLVVLALLSLAIRPPGRDPHRRRAESLPGDLVGLADATTAIPRIDPARPPAGGGRS
jgi:hypothetical protein